MSTEAPLIDIAAPRGLSRLWKRPVLNGIWCRIRPDAHVVVYSGDMSVKVALSDDFYVHSEFDGAISFTRFSDERQFSARTAPLYLAAAERQGIPITHVEGYRY